MAKQPAQSRIPFKDYYQVLHLHAEADAAMVDQAYWHLARLYNAAIPTDSSAGSKLEELNEAYSVLRSAALRTEYDRLRDVVLGENAPPAPPEPPKAPPPPLAVMAKAKPEPPKPVEPREEPPRAAPPEPLGVRRLRIPPWQSLVSAAVIVGLAGAALATGSQPAIVAALLILGLAFTLVPLVKNLPRLPELPRPAFQMPALRAPRLPERPAQASMDPDLLRRSTEEMRARWRQGTGDIPPAPTSRGPTSPEGPVPLTEDSDG